MTLLAGSEYEDWICDLCDLKSWSRLVKVQAWRCSQDKRLTKQATGCDYDICSQCMVERCVADTPETGEASIG